MRKRTFHGLSQQETLEARLLLACDLQLRDFHKTSDAPEAPIVADVAAELRESTFDELGFELLRQQFGLSGPDVTSDFNGNGTVDFGDFLILSRNFLPSNEMPELRESGQPLGSEPIIADLGHTLVIQGTQFDDLVEFHRLNDSQRWRIDVHSSTADGATTNGLTVDNFTSRRLLVDLGPGHDTLRIEQASLSSQLCEVAISGGEGNDAVRIETAAGRGDFHARIDLGEGDDALGIEQQSVAAGASSDVLASLGDGNDALQLITQHPRNQDSQHSIAVHAGDGNDQLNAAVVDELSREASLDLQLLGDAGDDVISLGLVGTVDGSQSVLADGGEGNDNLTANAENIDGNGQTEININGGADTDTIFALGPDEVTFANYEFELDGGTGDDSGNATSVTETESIETEAAFDFEELAQAVAVRTLEQNLTPRSAIESSDRTIEYWTSGETHTSQPVVVLFSGGGESIETWSSIAHQLAEKNQVIAVNRPGYGETDTIDDYSAAAVANDVEAVLQHITPDRKVIAVGHSFGGVLANAYARQHADRMAGIVFVDSSNPRQFDVYRELGFDVSDLQNNALLAISQQGVRTEFPNNDAVFEELKSTPNAFPDIPVITLSATPTETGLGVPPQLLTLQQELADLGSPGELRYVPDSGHYIHLDQPQTVLDAVRDMRLLTLEPEERITAAVRETMESYQASDVSGVLVYATRDGQEIVAETIGTLGLESETPLTIDSPFRIASTTKPMTAATILLLAEQGQIEIDAPIANYLDANLISRLHVLDGVSYGDQITVRHLLKHTSGLYDRSVDLKWIADVIANPDRVWQPIDLVNYNIDNFSPLFPPGTNYSYSDDGYVLLGQIIESVTGSELHTVYREQIFDRLGMDNTYLETHETPRDGEMWRSYLGPIDSTPLHGSVDWGGGGLISTAPDLAKFGNALLDGTLFTHESTLDTMTEHTEFGPNAMLFTSDISGQAAFSHGGFWGNVLTVVPQSGLVTVTVTNQNYSNIEQAAIDTTNALLTGKATTAPQRDDEYFLSGLLGLNETITPDIVEQFNGLSVEFVTRFDAASVEYEVNELPNGFSDLVFDPNNLVASGIVLGLLAEVSPQVEQPQDDAPGGNSLILDFTATFEGAIKPTGVGVNADGSRAAIVTEFERVLVIDTSNLQVVSEFNVGRDDTPAPGATQAITFVGEELGVLYPEDRVVAIFDLEGTRLGELPLEDETQIDGALTQTSGQLIFVSRAGGEVFLKALDPETGEIQTVLEFGDADELEPIVGLSSTPDGNGAVAITGTGLVFELSQSGFPREIGVVSEVAEPTGIEVFYNADDDEIQYGITEGSADFSDEPAPFRLFLESTIEPLSPADLPAAIDGVVADFVDQNPIPGVSVAIMKGDELLLEKGYGAASITTGEPFTTETLMPAGSIAKQFAAALTLDLAEDGVFSLSDPIGSYFESINTELGEVTIEQLLTHTGGINDELFDLAPDQIELDVVDTVLLSAPDIEPGSEFRYSNYGYIMLGDLLEVASGQSLPELVQTRIAEPLELDLYECLSVADDQSLTTGHVLDENGDYQATRRGIEHRLNGAFGLCMTATTLAEWERMYATGAVTTVHPATGIPDVPDPAFRYGYGMMEVEFDGETALGHTGGHPLGYITYSFYFPESDVTVVTLANTYAPGLDVLFEAISEVTLAVETEDSSGNSNLEDLVVEFAAPIAGAIQPSGVGVSPDGSRAAFVTDFEKVVVVDTANLQVVSEFGVGRRATPTQGATEAVTFVGDEQLAVLYPEDLVIGLFNLAGEPLGEITLENETHVDGALTFVDGQFYFVGRDANGAYLKLLDPESGAVSTAFEFEMELASIEGLSSNLAGDDVVAVTAGGTVLNIDPSGELTVLGVASEVDEPSGIEVFYDAEEDRANYGVTDDADEFNDEPSPFRLFVDS